MACLYKFYRAYLVHALPSIITASTAALNRSGGHTPDYLPEPKHNRECKYQEKEKVGCARSLAD